MLKQQTSKPRSKRQSTTPSSSRPFTTTRPHLASAQSSTSSTPKATTTTPRATRAPTKTAKATKSTPSSATPKSTPDPNNELFGKYFRQIDTDETAPAQQTDGQDGQADPASAQSFASLPPRTHIRSVHDLSYPQLKSVLEQTQLLRYKVDLKSTDTAAPKLAPHLLHRKQSVAIKPLEGLNALLVHSIDHKKDKHGEVLKSNLVQIPSLLGASRTDVVGTWNVRSLPDTILDAQHAFAQRNNIAVTPALAERHTALQTQRQEEADAAAAASQDANEQTADDAKGKKTKAKSKAKKVAKAPKFGTNGEDLSNALDHLETLYDVEFMQSLTEEQRVKFHAEMTTEVANLLSIADSIAPKSDQSQDQAGGDAVGSKGAKGNAKKTNVAPLDKPYDLILEFSTTRPQPRTTSLLPYIHTPTAQQNNIVPNPLNHAHFAPTIKRTTRRKASSTDQPPLDASNLPAVIQRNLTTPTITIKSEESALTSLLTIFSLLPQDVLFVNPNSLKVAFIGFDYSNTNVVPDLIYLCRRLGVNLALSTPTTSTQFYDMRLFEQSCLAQDKPLPEAKNATTAAQAKVKKTPKREKTTQELLEDPEIDYSLDEDGPNDVASDAEELEESMYDDLILLEPKLFIHDPAPGLSPHETDIASIKRYGAHIQAVSRSSGPDDDAAVEETDGPMSPNETLQSLRQKTKKDGSKNFTKATQQETKQRQHPATATSQSEQAEAEKKEKTTIYAPLVEYVGHPFAAVQLADVIITNSLFPATTHTYYDHPSYTLDKEMCHFAKDTVKIFHVTEGISNWKFPPLGVHDPRCMGAMQAEQESYVVAALAGVMTGKQVM